VATTNDLKNGLVLNLDGQLWAVTAFQHVKPGKGGAFVRTTLKNVLTGKVVDKTFNAGTKVDTATVDRRDMTYLYRDGSDFVFMDGDTYDQIPIPESTVGDNANYRWRTRRPWSPRTTACRSTSSCPPRSSW
jgi:elongation factor P